MIVEFECRHCKTKLRAENSIASPTSLCPVCNKKIIIFQNNITMKKTIERDSQNQASEEDARALTQCSNSAISR